MAIRENSTVNVIGGPYKGRTGKVVRVHDLVNIAIVSFDDNGDLGKTHFSELVEIEPQKQVVEPEIFEGAKKISRADFEEAVITATQPDFGENRVGAIMHALAAGVVGLSVAKEIFKNQDVVVMREDDLVVALWDGCNPKNVNASTGNTVSSLESLNVSISVIITLRKIVDILFCGSNNG